MIFELYSSGKTGRAIADLFNREGIITPNEYYYSTINKPNPFRNNKNRWGSASIMNIIKNPVYYGAMANGKRAVSSFKNKRIIRKSFDEWIIVENKHQPLISKDLWLEARHINSANKKETVRRSADGEVSIFAGIIKCADCGGNMIFNRKHYKSYTKEFFRCGTYAQKGKNVCPPHVIDYHVLYKAVSDDIKRYAKLAEDDENKLINRILKSNDEFKNKNLRTYEKTIRQNKNRICEIDTLVQSLFEEKVNGTVGEATFKRMTKKYEEEQQKLIDDTERLENEFCEYTRIKQDLTGWIEKIKNCLNIDTLTRAAAAELIERIEISESYDKDGEKVFDINILYKFGLTNSSCDENEKIEPTESKLQNNLSINSI
jgi:hypothetical protein